MKRTLPLLLTALFAAPGAHAGFFDFVKGLVKGNTMFISPPENQDMAKYHVLVVNTGSGPESAQLADIAEEQLAALKAGGVPYYSRVFRDTSVNTSAFDVAVISMSAGPSQVADSSGTEDRVQCANGKHFCKDDQARHYMVNCAIRTAVTPISISIRDNIASSMLANERRNVSTQSKVCSDRSGSLKIGSDLVSENYHSAIATLVARIGPKLEKRPLDLISSDDSITGADADKLKAANDAAAHNDMATACKMYDEMNVAKPNSGPILFNMGYCRQSAGAFAQAKALYDQASVASASPKDLLATYQAEVNGWLAKSVQSVIVTIPEESLASAQMRPAPPPASPMATAPQFAMPPLSAGQPALQAITLPSGQQATLVQLPNGQATILPGMVRPQAQPSGVAAAPADAPQRLRQIKALFDDGIISKAEYDAKRKAILESM